MQWSPTDMTDAGSPTDQESSSNNREHAKANSDCKTADQFPVTDSQTECQAEDGVNQRGDVHGPNDYRRAVGNQPKGGDHRRTDQQDEESERWLR